MIAFITALLGPKLLGIIGAAVAALLGVLVYGGSQRRAGRLAAQNTAKERDTRNAEEIERRADHARTVGGDAVERLRKRGHIRPD